jgi:hypothetical protein
MRRSRGAPRACTFSLYSRPDSTTVLFTCSGNIQTHFFRIDRPQKPAAGEGACAVPPGHVFCPKNGSLHYLHLVKQATMQRQLLNIVILPETEWLTVVNGVLALVTVLCVACILFGIVSDLVKRSQNRRARLSSHLRPSCLRRFGIRTNTAVGKPDERELHPEAFSDEKRSSAESH